MKKWIFLSVFAIYFIMQIQSKMYLVTTKEDTKLRHSSPKQGENPISDGTIRRKYTQDYYDDEEDMDIEKKRYILFCMIGTSEEKQNCPCDSMQYEYVVMKNT